MDVGKKQYYSFFKSLKMCSFCSILLSFPSIHASFSKAQNERKENHKQHVPFVDGYSSLLGASKISICSWGWSAFVTHTLSWFRLPYVLCTSIGRITAKLMFANICRCLHGVNSAILPCTFHSFGVLKTWWYAPRVAVSWWNVFTKETCINSMGR